MRKPWICGGREHLVQDVVDCPIQDAIKLLRTRSAAIHDPARHTAGIRRACQFVNQMPERAERTSQCRFSMSNRVSSPTSNCVRIS